MSSSTSGTVIGPHTRVLGSVVSEEDVTVLGTVDGGIECKGTVTLRSGSTVNGDILAARISIDEGALFDGQVRTVAAERKSGPVRMPMEGRKAASVPESIKTDSAPLTSEPPKAEPIKAEPIKAEPIKAETPRARPQTAATRPPARPQPAPAKPQLDSTPVKQDLRAIPALPQLGKTRLIRRADDRRNASRAQTSERRGTDDPLGRKS